ncbi:MAG: hypothetical protein E6I96_03215 [Chloroflexi bacterium]|nr:MAG: hypothetical protein E6I96_03215 [Chloroflexota bacterium]
MAFTTRPELKGTKRSAGSSRSFATTGQALRPCISVQGGRGLGRCFATPTWPPLGVLEELRRRGHEVVEEARWSLGRICAVGRNPQTGILSAAASLRGAQAYAAGR